MPRAELELELEVVEGSPQRAGGVVVGHGGRGEWVKWFLWLD